MVLNFVTVFLKYLVIIVNTTVYEFGYHEALQNDLL